MHIKLCKKFCVLTNVAFASAGLLAMALMSTGCTRSVSHTAHISIQMPQSARTQGVSAQSTQIGHIAISVSAPDISPPVSFIWDQNGGAAAPGSIPLDIPDGSARVFQALVGAQDSTTGNVSLYYGDFTQDVDSSTTAVSIAAHLLGATSTAQSLIAGRYLDVNGNGPTGMMRLMYFPTDGNQPMLADRSPMFGGWFSEFAIAGVPFVYELPDGTPMFGVDVNNKPIQVAADTVGVAGTTASTNVARITFPASFYTVDHNGSTYTNESGGIDILGTFGPGASSAIPICYTNGTPPVIQNASSTSGSQTAVNWSSAWASGGTGYATGTNLSDPLNSQAVCAMGGTQYTNYLAVDVQELAHHDAMLDTQGPYVAAYYSGSNLNALNVTATPGVNPSPDTVSISYQYLPGARTGTLPGVDGTDLYYRGVPSTYGNYEDFKGNNDNVMCGMLSSLPVPFQLLVSRADSSDANSTGTLTIPSGTIANATGSFQIVACPYQTVAGVKQYLPGVFWEQNGSGGPQPATSMEILNADYTPASTPTLNPNVCTPFILQGLDSSMNHAQLPSTSSITFAGTNSVLAYTDSNCSSAWPSSALTQDNGSSYLFYVKSSAGTTLTVTATGLPSLTVNMAAGAISFATNNKLSIGLQSSNLRAYTCYPISFLQMDSGSGSVVPFSTGYTLYYPTTPTGLTFYMDGQCVTPLSSFIVGSVNPVLNDVYVEYSSMTAASGVNLQPVDSSQAIPCSTDISGTCTGASSVNFAAPASLASQFAIRMPNNYSKASNPCVMVDIQSQDSNGNPSPPSTTASTSINTLSASSGAFWSTDTSGACTCGGGSGTVISPPVTMNMNTTDYQLCYAAATTGLVSINASSSTPVLSGSQSINVNP